MVPDDDRGASLDALQILAEVGLEFADIGIHKWLLYEKCDYIMACVAVSVKRCSGRLQR
jgi:hypothetical protein